MKPTLSTGVNANAELINPNPNLTTNIGNQTMTNKELKAIDIPSNVLDGFTHELQVKLQGLATRITENFPADRRTGLTNIDALTEARYGTTDKQLQRELVVCLLTHLYDGYGDEFFDDDYLNELTTSINDTIFLFADHVRNTDELPMHTVADIHVLNTAHEDHLWVRELDVSLSTISYECRSIPHYDTVQNLTTAMFTTHVSGFYNGKMDE